MVPCSLSRHSALFRTSSRYHRVAETASAPKSSSRDIAVGEIDLPQFAVCLRAGSWTTRPQEALWPSCWRWRHLCRLSAKVPPPRQPSCLCLPELSSTAGTFAVESTQQRVERGRLGKGQDRLERERVAVCVVAIGHAATPSDERENLLILREGLITRKRGER